jgi:hypothetical protein
MRTPAQRRNLRILRDEILPGIEEGELNMSRFFKRDRTPSCLAGYAYASRRFQLLEKHIKAVIGLGDTFGVFNYEWTHIFGPDLPNDPSWLAANITDLLESET